LLLPPHSLLKDRHALLFVDTNYFAQRELVTMVAPRRYKNADHSI
jgi:hypothetical protein